MAAGTPNPLRKMSADMADMLIDSLIADQTGLDETRTDEEVRRYMYLAACVGYFVGSLDRIEDRQGTNEMRGLKSKDIPAAVRMIAQLAGLHGMDEQSIIEQLKQYRKLPRIKGSSEATHE